MRAYIVTLSRTDESWFQAPWRAEVEYAGTALGRTVHCYTAWGARRLAARIIGRHCRPRTAQTTRYGVNREDCA